MQVGTRGDVILVMTNPQKRMGFAYNSVRGVRTETLLVDTLLKWGYWEFEDRPDGEVAKMEAAPQIDRNGVPTVERPMQEALILEHLPGQHDQASHNPHNGSSLTSNTELRGELDTSPFIAAIQKNGGFTFPASVQMDEWATDVVKIDARNVTSGFAVARKGFAKSMDKAHRNRPPNVTQLASGFFSYRCQPLKPLIRILRTPSSPSLSLRLCRCFSGCDPSRGIW